MNLAIEILKILETILGHMPQTAPVCDHINTVQKLIPIAEAAGAAAEEAAAAQAQPETK